MPLAHNGSNEGSSPFGLRGWEYKNLLFSEHAEIGSQAFVK